MSKEVLTRMATAVQHRGPDGFGVFSGRRVGLAHARLSIIDVVGGAQPLGNEDGSVIVIFNGEIYNYVELREELLAKGHAFRTSSDTEVLVHGYEQWGESLLHRLNGQFAFAIYDRRNESLLLARDRFGICPLFVAHRNENLYFASEVKALFASGEVPAEADVQGVDEVFTFWAARAPRTPFKGVEALEPGCFARWRNGRLQVRRYYDLHFYEESMEPRGALDSLSDVMWSGVRLRLRADVPVGGYLSGGLDSSVTCALASVVSPHQLSTFSVSFADPTLDESEHQRLMAAHIGSRHEVQFIGDEEVGSVFPEVVWHAETPLVRTAPAPMYLLSRLTRDNDVKVVLTGEGSDEFFLGYDIFKETRLRQFCLRQPMSKLRPRLFDRLYPYLGHSGRAGEFWQKFFLNAGPTNDPLFSHLPRFNLTSRIKDFYSDEMRIALAGADALGVLRQMLPGEFSDWSPLNRAAYLEITTLLSSYLLSSQGERMAMAHGVEPRFPFLDHRVFEFAAGLPVDSKLRGLREKDILKRWATTVVPDVVVKRHKQPYRAPDVPAFFGARRPQYVDELLEPSNLRRTGYFDERAVAGLVRRCATGRATGFAENQALVAILSTQLWHRAFLETPAAPGRTRWDRASVALTEDHLGEGFSEVPVVR